MAAGRHAFTGQGADLDDAILNDHPPSLKGTSPIHLAMEGVIAGCLEKDASKRRQRIQNAVIELKLAGKSLPSVAAIVARRRMGQMAMPLPAAAAPPPAALTPLTAAPPALAVGPHPALLQAAPPRPSPVFLTDGQAGATVPTDPWIPPPPTAAGGLLRRIIIIALTVLALAASGLAVSQYLHQRPTAPVVKFSVAAPENTSYPGTPSVSPDGLSLTFSAVGPEGQRMLWLRALDEMHARVIPGTEGGFAPFWSPDSQYIAFFANQALKRVRIRNSTLETQPETIAPADAEPGGGAWNRDGVIVFAPGMNDGLYKVSASGGKVTPELQLDAARFEHAHLWPQFLPDGKHFVFFNQTATAETTGVYAGAMGTGEKRKLLSSETNAIYSSMAGAESSPTGYLLYMRGRDLMGQGFNAATLAIAGDAITLANDIGFIRTLALAPISVSDNAILVYQNVGAPVRQLMWMEREGRHAGTVGDGAMWGPPRISPDGNRLVVAKLGDDGVNADLWLFDIRGGATEFAHTPKVSEGFPIWSPDGTRIAYWSNPDGVSDLYVKQVNGTKSELLYKSANDKFPTDWSRDGKFILFHELVPGAKLDVMALSLPDKRAAGVVNTVKMEAYPALSPDGRWLAFQSDDSGRLEVYVQPFEGLSGGTRRRWKVSSHTGNGQNALPRWRGDGKELFYITVDGNIMSVNVSLKDGEFASDTPKILFQTRPVPQSFNFFDVTPDGQRFIVNLPLEWSNSSVITVMTNWTEKLKS
jgi:Tol biopolymer transport system component